MTSENTQSIFPFAANVTSTRILNTPSPFARSSLFFLQETGRLEALASHTSRHVHLASFLFFVVYKGKGKLVFGEKIYKLIAGDCVFIDCKKDYHHQTDSNDLWTLQWAHFNGVNMPSVYDKYLERGGQPVFKPKDIKPFNAILSELYELTSSDDYIRDMRINEKLGGLLTLIMAESWHPEYAGSASRQLELGAVKMYLDEHYAKKISLDFLSETFFINKYYLARLFKEHYGITVGDYLRTKRITVAKQLLRFSDHSIEVIAGEVGFGDIRYFCRVFKKVEGVSPGAFRKMW